MYTMALARYYSENCPVAVPDKIIASRRMLDFIDRCHSLTSLTLPPAALGSLPPMPTSLITFLFGDKKVISSPFRKIYTVSKLITFDTSIIFITTNKKEGAANRSFSYYV